MPISAFAYTDQELAGNAKITIDQARSIALKARPGTITDEELEKEKGGSGLRYSFNVKSGKVVYEVGVDEGGARQVRKDEACNPFSKKKKPGGGTGLPSTPAALGRGGASDECAAWLA